MDSALCNVATMQRNRMAILRCVGLFDAETDIVDLCFERFNVDIDEIENWVLNPMGERAKWKFLFSNRNWIHDIHLQLWEMYNQVFQNNRDGTFIKKKYDFEKYLLIRSEPRKLA